jgi:hypothetical protein
MDTMCIKKTYPIRIQVDGFPDRAYIGYSVRDAERLYRKEFGLKWKHYKKVTGCYFDFGYMFP